MGTIGDDTQKGGPEPVRDFIFARELAEVYLLLDHLSGRSDKTLSAAIGDGKDDTGRKWIEDICAIGWPPEGTPVEQSAQAATLLLAKDRLNAAAKPATGASIVFTLMVAGDDDMVAVQAGLFRRIRGLFSRSADGSTAPNEKANPPSSSEGPSKDASAVAALPRTAVDPAANSSPGASGGGKNGGGNSAGVFGRYPPSRISLAKLAYPGLIGSAGHFKSRFNVLLFLLFVFLIFTCMLSWHVTAGRAILARLDAIETARTAIQKRIVDAEVGPPARTAPISAATGSSPTPQVAESSPIASPDSPKHYVQRYCERASRLPPPNGTPAGVKIEQFEDATQLQICDQLTENRTSYNNAREDIADWLAPWGWLKWLSHKFCGGNCDQDIELKVDAVNQQQWAAVVADVLATAVLPLCYGFLGAGAAVVRNIWGKMRYSLLSPRDLPLSLGQLALGAVIGACIGLFVTPTGVGSQSAAGLTGSATLTPSALSFIAGFSVEGVFVALESLVKRVFNLSDQKP